MPYDTGRADVDEMINRDVESWEKSLREAGGDLYSDDDLQGVIRNVSYAQNAGHDPREFIDAARQRYGDRRAPTASAGGRGGDADLNGDGALDAGWVRNPDRAMGKSVLRQSDLPQQQTLADLANVGGRTATASRTQALSEMTPTTLGGLAQLSPTMRPRQVRWWGSY